MGRTNHLLKMLSHPRAKFLVSPPSDYFPRLPISLHDRGSALGWFFSIHPVQSPLHSSC